MGPDPWLATIPIHFKYLVEFAFNRALTPLPFQLPFLRLIRRLIRTDSSAELTIF